MEIKGVTITKTELHEAVQQWLDRQGLKVQVTDVEKKYSYSSVYDVQFKLTVDPDNEEPARLAPLPEVLPIETELAKPKPAKDEVTF